MRKVGHDQPFDHIAVIYNPRSHSQKADKIAARLVRRLKRAGFSNITLADSQHFGHARELAYQVAAKYKTPLIISVSGDGGYNEVINGIMDAKEDGTAQQPYAAVEAAGNANDHYTVLRHKTTLVQAFKRNDVLPIDLLQLEARAADFQLKRYAHSYIGFGVTPYIARELNLQKRTRLQEIQLLASMVAKFPPFLVQFENGTEKAFDSLIFSNIRRMAKVLRVARQTEPDDGSFEVVAHPHQKRRAFVLTAIKTAVRGRKSSQKAINYSFALPEAQSVQFDGEVIQLPAGCEITITCKHHALRTF
ncbi:MAG: diacylglycerol kinase catalytic subunit [Candidatus Saccharibacteria bacterium]|nr:diacylglycerol kinase catalytic subunit [Candidatus Saccharibacteria bacterium]